MADKDTPCMLVRDSADLVCRMPIARLLRMTADYHGDIGPGDAYVTDLMSSLNRGADDGRTEIEQVLVAEYDNVLELLAGIDDDLDDGPSPAP